MVYRSIPENEYYGLTERERILRVLTLPEALYLRSSSMIQEPMAPAPITAKLEDIFARDKDEGEQMQKRE